MTAIALTIAGSDSGGGAGIQADLKTFSALGVYGCSVITAVTAQNTKTVSAVHAIPNAVVVAQIKAVLDDIDVDAIKIGMLGTPDLVACVADALVDFHKPIVLDPVMISKSGAPLLPDESVAALRDLLVPRATVLTPNIPEAARLLEADEDLTDDGLIKQGRALLSYGPHVVLMKGGHGTGDICTDWVITPEGQHAQSAERVDTKNTHGTGCTYSSAITAGLAKGQSVETAIQTAHGWLHQAIRRSDELDIGHGHGPVHHFHGDWK